MYSLELQQVYKQFSTKVAVRNLDLQVPEGSIYGFLGPNGAGKTTTIRMIMSILHPDRGNIEVLGSPAPQAVKHRLGYLPEEKGLYKKMQALELIAYFGRLKGMTRHDARNRAGKLLDQFGLGHCARSRCDSLSKGMGQKVQILATLIHEPEFVILDEPFSGLDPINVEVVRQLILDLKREGRTVIFSTHVMEQAEQICDYLMLIHQGNKLLDGALSDIKRTSEPTLQIEYDGILPPTALQGLQRVNDMGKKLELTIAEDTDTQALLAELMTHVRVNAFVVHEPTLHEIFVRTIKGAEA